MGSNIQLFLNYLTQQCTKLNGYTEAKTMRERINCILSNETIVDEMRQKVNCLPKKAENGKCLKAAHEYWFRGNEYFQSQDYQNALLMYSSAIIKAPLPSKKLTYAFISRSRASLHLKNYNAVLEDVRAAFTFGYDEKYHWELYYEMGVAFYYLRKYKESHHFMIRAQNSTPEISFNENIQKYIENLTHFIDNDAIDAIDSDAIHMSLYPILIPNNSPIIKMDERIEMLRDPTKGRFMKAKEMIPQNSIILMEKPHSWSLKINALNIYCYNCLEKLDFARVWPCHGCSEVMYCSMRCSEQTWSKFHRYECGSVSFVQELDLNLSLALRSIYRVGIENAIQLFHRRDYFKENQLKNNHSESHLFSQIYSLMDHCDELLKEKENSLDCDSALFKGFVLYMLIERMGLYTAKELNEKLDICEMLALMVQKVHVNCFLIFNHPIRDDSVYISEKNFLGCCMLFWSALANHSCDPNIKWHFHGNTIHFITVRPIEKDEEITISYGTSILKQNVINRWSFLRKHYYFNCSCSGCFDQWKHLNAYNCIKCTGPVIAMKNLCLQCGHNEQMFEKKRIVNEHINMINESIGNIENNIDVETNLKTLEVNVDVLSNHLYYRSTQLIYIKSKATILFEKYEKLSPLIDQCIDILMAKVELNNENFHQIYELLLQKMIEYVKIRNNNDIRSSLKELIKESIPYLKSVKDKDTDAEMIHQNSVLKMLRNVKIVKRKDENIIKPN